MSILSDDLDIKFRLGNYYNVIPRWYSGDKLIDELMAEVRNVELDADFKIQTKKVRRAVRRILGEKYYVKRVALACSWRFECYPEDQKGLADYLWNIPGRVEFYINREIQLS